MKRRTALRALGGIVADVTLGAQAQAVSMPVIGFLNAASSEPFAHVVRAFRAGLNETGYVEDKDVAIEYRWAHDQYDRLPALAEDLVRRRMSVIATGSNLIAAKAAMAATTTIPIVFLVGSDPVKAGLVATLARPGGNVTGIATLNVELGLKRFEVLHELVPATTVVGLLINPINDPAFVELSLRQAQAGALALGMQLHVLYASTEREVDSAFSTLVQRRAGGLVITPDTFFSSRSAQLGALALRHSVPAVSPYREFVAAGGLMSYGGSLTDQYRQVGVYTGRILKGEKPAELPVRQVEKVEFVINMKTAKALALTVPQSLLARVNEVVQ
jgi:putative ABC transport system substrate-binding protein